MIYHTEWQPPKNINTTDGVISEVEIGTGHLQGIHDPKKRMDVITAMRERLDLLEDVTVSELVEQKPSDNWSDPSDLGSDQDTESNLSVELMVNGYAIYDIFKKQRAEVQHELIIPLLNMLNTEVLSGELSYDQALEIANAMERSVVKIREYADREARISNLHTVPYREPSEEY
jgi:hypothetical protein